MKKLLFVLIFAVIGLAISHAQDLTISQNPDGTFQTVETTVKTSTFTYKSGMDAIDALVSDFINTDNIITTYQSRIADLTAHESDVKARMSKIITLLGGIGLTMTDVNWEDVNALHTGVNWTAIEGLNPQVNWESI